MADFRNRDYTDIYKQLSNLYCIIRNFYAEKTGFMSDLAHKTRRLIEKNAEQTGLGGFIKEVTFDVDTLNALCEASKKEKGEEEEKRLRFLIGFRFHFLY